MVISREPEKNKNHLVDDETLPWMTEVYNDIGIRP